MKNLTSILFSLLIISIFSFNSANAQVTVSGALTGNGSYTTLSAAFTAINNFAQTGANINISITANTTEPATGVGINNGAWSGILIQPSGNITVTGTINNGIPLIDFIGGDNITIDGLNTGGNSLTISNPNTASNSGTGTVRFRTDATNNIITNCKLLGSSTAAFATDGAVVTFGGNSSLTGNDNNLISYCEVGPAGANLPLKCFEFVGTQTSLTVYNSGDTIRNCNIYDYFNAASQSAGIHVDQGNTDISIINNRFYQTAPRTQTTGTDHAGIFVNSNPSSGINKGNNYIINGNIIGNSSSSGIGTYTFNGVAGSKFVGIFLSVDTITASNVQGNTIAGISVSGNMGGTQSGGPVKGIFINKGLVNTGSVTGNIIGSQSDTSSIVYSSSSTSTSDIFGLYNLSLNSWNCSNNNIGGITASNSSTGAINIYCIRAGMSSSATFTCQNNITGGNVPFSVRSNSTSTSTRVNGIYDENPAGNITGNTVRNLQAAGGTGGGLSASVCGIDINASSANHTISQNNIYALSNSNSSASSIVTGIYFISSTGTNLIERNLIHAFNFSNNNASLLGINAGGGTATYQNNMIQLGLDTSGSSVNVGGIINGINESSGTNNFYFNSIYIGGTPTSGTSSTYAFLSTVNTNPRIYKNNIYYNARSNSGSTGKHFALKINGPTGLITNNNVYLANGTGSVLGNYNGSDKSDLATWKSSVGQDFYSYSSDPQYLVPNGSLSTINLHINPSVATIIEGHGTDIISITNDYDGETRSGLTPVDIGADAGNFISLPQNDSNVFVTGAITGNGNYATLADAFIAINFSTQTGANVIITIAGNTTEPITGVILNSGTWTSLTLKPSGTRTITGTISAGTPLIDLNGADNVTIDGLNSGGNSLTISNPNTSSSAGTSTLRLKNDAVNNVITRTTFLGSSTVSFATDGGVISIAGASGAGTGNDNNVISFCDIGPAGSNLPLKGIQLVGSTTLTQVNNSDTIRNCNIYDYFHPTSQSGGIHVDRGNTNMIIKDNRFYQTSARTQTSGNDHAGIWLISADQNASNNFIISGNIIGYASSSGTGTYTLNGTGNTRFTGIFLSIDSSGTSSVQGNLIAGISISGNINGTVGSALFKGIYIGRGLMNIGNVTGNTIGSLTGNGSISVSSTSSSAGDLLGIYNISSNMNCSNNIFGSITMSNSGTGSANIFCLRSSLNSNLDTAVFQNNIIGGTDANSIQSSSSSTSSQVAGIIIEKGNSALTGNTVRNLSSSAGTGTNNSASIIGILANVALANHTLSQNTIYNLQNSNTSASTTVTGIYFNGSAVTNLISKNFIHNLIVSSNTSVLNGLQAAGGTSTYQNNMIQLGLDTSGNSITNGAVINGINETGGTDNFYFNSVYIGGSPSSGSSNTFAFSSIVTTNARIFQNNIFYNARSNSGSTGKNYAVKIGGNAPNPAGLSIDYNVYLANGSGGVFGSFNGSDIANLPAWQAAVGQDANSIESNPQYITPNGSTSTVDLHINPSVGTPVESNGINIVSVSDDYDGQTRSALTPVDIGADAGNFIMSNPVMVSGAVSGNGGYSKLSAAFSAINAASQTAANIIILIRGNFTEDTTGAVLSQGAWSTLIIKPSSGSKTITGTTSSGVPLIDLNGADNVTIDGLKSSGDSLTISNTSTSSVSGTSTIRFKADATNNSIQNCKILGSTQMGIGTDGGNILFSSGSSSAGNSNNTISNCDIGPAGTTPAMGIYSSGTSSFPNTSDTIRNCNIYDYFNASGESGGIAIGAGSAGFVIKNNKFYQTSPRTQLSAQTHYAIRISTTTGNNFTVSGNTIGYSNSSGTGTYTINGVNAARLLAIFMTVGTSSASNIQGNIISNISFAGNINGIGTAAALKLIYISSGLVNIGDQTGNIIGSQSDTASIVYNTSSSNASDVAAIYNSSASAMTCSNNVIGGIYCSNSSTGGIVIYGIRSSMSGTVRLSCQNNIVGGNVQNSIQTVTSNNSSRVDGIYCFTQADIFNNTVRNLTCSSGNQINEIAPVIGIIFSKNSGNNSVSRNTVYSINNSSTTSASMSTGIYFSGSAGINLISGNFVRSISGSNSTAVINGIQVAGGTATFQNNMIQLGTDTSGNSLNTGARINGINCLTGTNSFYFNSVYIGGNPTGGSSNTFAFTTSDTNTRVYKNNIFYNGRSNNGSTGKHYAVNVAGTVPNPAGLTINNNIYLANGSGGVFGFYNGTDVTSLTSWRSAVGQDTGSFESNPHFINPNGTLSSQNLHINPSTPTAVESNGFDISTITDDYDGQTRSALTPVDIGADAGNFTPLVTTRTLNLTMLIQGFYDAGSDKMVRDTLRVYLRNSASPYTVIDSAQAYLDSLGAGTFTFSNASDGTPYYLHLKHRNSIETWSSTTQSFTAGALTYDFTDSTSKAFGNNMIQTDASPLRYAIYGGDVSQDGTVDLSDIINIFNDANNFVTGYVITDVTGDDIVDLSDIIIAYNNSNNFVSAIIP